MKFHNQRKQNFISKLPKSSVDNSRLSERSKFNFSFFEGQQDAGQDFNELTHLDMVKIFEKLKNYGKDKLNYWRSERCGAGGLKVFSEYGDFPRKSDFTHPPHVPHDVKWARFRLEASFRLVGFLIPDSLHGEVDKTTGFVFCRNTFYVVFLDKEHKFYKTEDC